MGKLIKKRPRNEGFLSISAKQNLSYFSEEEEPSKRQKLDSL